MFKRYAGALVALIMSVGMITLTSGTASAHTADLTGRVGCNDDGSTWWAEVHVNITNTPINDTAEVKAISATRGTFNPGEGSGVMAGAQVILNAWAEHAVNWPGVQTRKGNWTDTFIIANIPSSTRSVSVMVQSDWKKWGRSADYNRYFSKPPTCEPRQDEEPPVVTPPVEEPPVLTPPPAAPPITQPPTLVPPKVSPPKVKRPKHLPPRITVIDKCKCKDDRVMVKSKHLLYKYVHQDKNVFTIRLIVKPGYVLPVDFKHPSKGWARSVKYTVKTTNTKCPCPPGKRCGWKPKPPPSPCARRCN